MAEKIFSNKRPFTHSSYPEREQQQEKKTNDVAEPVFQKRKVEHQPRPLSSPDRVISPQGSPKEHQNFLPPSNRQEGSPRSPFNSPSSSTLGTEEGPQTPSPVRVVFNPPRVLKKGRKKSNRPPFPEKDLLQLEPIDIQLNARLGFRKFVEINGMYVSEQGEQKICIKQPPQPQSCGAGVALIFLSHFMIQNEALTLSPSFWNWYIRIELASYEDVARALREDTNLEKNDFQIEIYFFHLINLIQLVQAGAKPLKGLHFEGIDSRGEKLKNRLKTLQEETKSPLIVSITNPAVAGHWIIIDMFNDKEKAVYIRDPFKGAAYKIW